MGFSSPQLLRRSSEDKAVKDKVRGSTPEAKLLSQLSQLDIASLSLTDVTSFCSSIAELTSLPVPAGVARKRLMVENYLLDNGIYNGISAAPAPKEEPSSPARAPMEGPSSPPASRLDTPAFSLRRPSGFKSEIEGEGEVEVEHVAAMKRMPQWPLPSKTKPLKGLLSSRGAFGVFPGSRPCSARDTPDGGDLSARLGVSALLVRVHISVKSGGGWVALEESRGFSREVNALTRMPVGLDTQQYVADFYNWHRWQVIPPLSPKSLTLIPTHRCPTASHCNDYEQE